MCRLSAGSKKAEETGRKKKREKTGGSAQIKVLIQISERRPGEKGVPIDDDLDRAGASKKGRLSRVEARGLVEIEATGDRATLGLIKVVGYGMAARQEPGDRAKRRQAGARRW